MDNFTQQLNSAWMYAEAFIELPVTGVIRAKDARGTAASAFAWKEFTF